MSGAAENETWIFAYGSLMWRPGFSYVEACHARLSGFHRAFCVYSVHYRGSPNRPGLVLGLDRGGACEGVAFKLSPATAAQSRDYLRHRELIYGVYREASVPLTLLGENRRRVRATTYIAERVHPAHAGALKLTEQAALIRGAMGLAGTNIDYLINTIEHLQELGINEPSLARLLTLAGGAFVAAGPEGPTRPRAISMARAWTMKAIAAPQLKRQQHFGYRNKLR
jgi:glutathione-specific gamma-glutamylcyclotransferase